MWVRCEPRRIAHAQIRLCNGQPSVQHFGLVATVVGRRCELEIRPAASGQRQFQRATPISVGSAYHPPPCPARHGRRGAGQWLHVVATIGRRRHPQSHDRRRRGGLHGRVARPAFLFNPDSRLPVVSGAGQECKRPSPPQGRVLFIDARNLAIWWTARGASFGKAKSGAVSTRTSCVPWKIRAHITHSP